MPLPGALIVVGLECLLCLSECRMEIFVVFIGSDQEPVRDEASERSGLLYSL